MIEVRHAYLTDHVRNPRSTVGESMTEQHHKDDCDINCVLRRLTGDDYLTRSPGPEVYGEMPEELDYHLAFNKVQAVQAAFDELGPVVRERFKNRPAALLAFLDDPSNLDEGIELGLLVRPEGHQTAKELEAAAMKQAAVAEAEAALAARQAAAASAPV